MKSHLDIPEKEIEKKWPNLELNNHHETSTRSTKYNCIAWVIGDETEKWAPYTGYKWFKGFRKLRNYPGEDIEAHKIGFASIGYENCPDCVLEEGFEKIAFYVRGNSVEHIARQKPNSNWTSKLGEYHDIEHYTLKALEEGFYGKAIVFMKRKRSNELRDSIKRALRSLFGFLFG